MCGGGGGGGNSAVQDEQMRQMRADEARRAQEEMRRQAAVAHINRLYGLGGGAEAERNLNERNAAYGQVRQNNLNLMMDDIGRNRDDAQRAVRFGLARSGLAGGSVDIDANRQITDANQRSIIQANQLADAQVAKMKSDDENTRADLISRINAGMDADSAAAAAARRVVPLSCRFDVMTTSTPCA